MYRKTLIIGLDSADRHVSRPYFEDDTMPNLAGFFKQGVSGTCELIL
jgi:predicted AlkP superfamily phosphohydrolase/phosphomutase